MRAVLTAILLLTSIGTAFAGNPYLYELLSQQPYRQTFVILLKQMPQAPDYTRDVLKKKGSYLGLMSPSKTITIAGTSYRIATICAANVICTEYGSVFLFSTDGRQAWAEIRDGDKPIWLGAPDDAKKRALDKAFDD